MAKDYIVLGILPLSEPFPEDKEFREKYLRSVIVVYLDQLRRSFPFDQSRFTIRSGPDNESFFVSVDFDDEDQFDFDKARNIADELPYCWDEISQKELGKQYFKDLKEVLCNNHTTLPTSLEANNG